MRLSEDQIKQAILHADPYVRNEAVRYFAEAYAPDPTVMPVVIRAIEQYGDPAYPSLLDWAEHLPQTAETLDWVFRQFDDGEKAQGHFGGALRKIVLAADVELLRPRLEDIHRSRHLSDEEKAIVSQRLEMAGWDAETLWRKLLAFCAENKHEQYVGDVDLDYANRLVEALGRHGAAVEARVLDALAQEIEDYEDNPLAWLEPLAVQLAGEARLRSALPLVVTKLQVDDDADLLFEEGSTALVKIGGEEAVRAIADAFPASGWTFRLYAASALEHLHYDLTVSWCLDRLPREEHDDIQHNLAIAALSQFATEAVEPARQLVLHMNKTERGRNRTMGLASIGLDGKLVDACTVMGETFPELGKWRATLRKGRHKTEKLMTEWDADNDIGTGGWDAPEEVEYAPPAPAWSPPQTLPFERVDPKVGRNDPCPCGSGKKFKKCCMNKQ